MKLFYISQSASSGYDTYDSAIVAAKSEDDAKKIHPSGDNNKWGRDTWCSAPEQVEAKLIGTAVVGTKQGVVLASFNAG